MVTEAEVKLDAFKRCDSANAARALNKSEGTLANWRTAGVGPTWRKINGRIYYNFADLEAFARGETALVA